ncbi:hypothetical protein [Photobacterium sanguinicancri]|uniref:hypothetical protein n=1 Tax=Photobacterium sanguinicancri TaxID=875932 RepID=UPI0026E1DDAF|nr:hypothetical protein [Photobacterium sanguinicancri]MDO6501169.1 hypothetical protein [Photobacterium sanguinicancri]
MEIRIRVSGVGINIPKTSFGLNLFSGCYIETRPNKGNAPTRIYGIIDTLSLGNESGTVVVGHAVTDWIKITKQTSIDKLKHQFLIGKTADIEIKGTSFGNSKGDVSLKIIDDNNDSITVIDKYNININAYQFASTKIRGKIRHQVIAQKSAGLC